jgi:PAS domain S-box-containing protein
LRLYEKRPYVTQKHASRTKPIDSHGLKAPVRIQPLLPGEGVATHEVNPSMQGTRDRREHERLENNLQRTLRQEQAVPEGTIRAPLADERQTPLLVEKGMAPDDQRLRLLLESTEDIVVMQDLEGRCIYYHGPREFGLKDEDMLGKMAAGVLDVATAVSITVRVRHVAATGQGLAFEQRVERNGKTFWFLARISPVLDNSGRITATALVARNITSRKQAEESLRTANILLERTFAGLNEAVFVIHPSLRTITTCNAAVERIFGYKTKEILGRTIGFLFPDSTHYADYLSSVTEALEQDGIFDSELQNRKKDGTIIPTEHTVTGIRDDSGKRTSLVTVVRDITERKRMEEVLLRARNLESIGYLAGGIAHDFNNLLTTIIGNISLVKMVTSPDEKSFKRLEDAENTCLRASILTKQLITFSRGGTPIRQRVFVGKLIREEIAFCLNGTGTTNTFEEPGGLWAAKVDGGQIRQAIDSIIRNASEAMHGGGHLIVTTANTVVNSTSGLPLKEGEYVHVSFSDTGIGIPEENLPKIFDPYFTTKGMGSQKGMGLGLAIAYSIVTTHEGAITVESQEAVGTTFHLYLPADESL